jgi:hypothetical protein
VAARTRALRGCSTRPAARRGRQAAGSLHAGPRRALRARPPRAGAALTRAGARAAWQSQDPWEGGAAVGGTFRVVWLRRYDLPFGATEHLANPLNEGKPVKVCRDGQELPAELGEALVALIEAGADAAGVPRPARPLGAAPARGCVLACGALAWLTRRRASCRLYFLKRICSLIAALAWRVCRGSRGALQPATPVMHVRGLQATAWSSPPARARRRWACARRPGRQRRAGPC